MLALLGGDQFGGDGGLEEGQGAGVVIVFDNVVNGVDDLVGGAEVDHAN